MTRPIEPHADLRKAAVLTYEMYAAYVQAGFTEEQALRLIMAHVASGDES